MSEINGLNLYMYCKDNPVMYVDSSGSSAISIGLLMGIGFWVGAVIGASASVAGQYLSNGRSWKNFSWGQLALDILLGGASGLLSMSSLGLGAMVAANAGLGFVGAVGGHLINESDFLKGQNKRGWTVTFDWFIKPNNFIKVLEDTYKNKGESGNGTSNMQSVKSEYDDGFNLGDYC